MLNVLTALNITIIDNNLKLRRREESGQKKPHVAEAARFVR
jgi:hypothetical protein